ncbi:phage stabilization protein [Bacteriophage sp.]|nr:phage stabilization protein [Bacteriophage sp.]UOF80122.1 phage stabilization protein [Bacteriophage sp.]
MAREKPIPLPHMRGGVDRHRLQAYDVAAEAIDVIEDGGLVTRRDSWLSFLAGPVLFLPAGRSLVAVDGVLDTDRRVTQAQLLGAGDGYCYVGATTPFDGIEWGDITASSETLTSHRRIALEYSNGSDWVAIEFLLDTTNCYLNGSTYSGPLLRTGRLHWHRVQLASWATSVVAGTTAYWVRFRPERLAGGVDYAGLSWTMSQPGIRVFLRPAINAILPLRVGGGKHVLLIGGDRQTRRGLEAGAAIGLNSLSGGETVEQSLTRRYTAGLWGAVAFPSVVTPGGSPATANAGTANEFYDWGPADGVSWPLEGHLKEQQYGAIFRTDVAPNALGTTSQFTTTDAIIIGLKDNDLEHFIVECTTSGGGPAVGERRECQSFSISGGVATIVTSPTWTAAPTTSSRFQIINPSNLIYVAQARREYTAGQQSTASTQLVAMQQATFNNPTDILGSSAHVHFECREPTRWHLPSGNRYSACVNGITRSVIFTNGGPLLEYDGHTMRRLAAGREDDPLAEQLLGVLPTTGPESLSDPRTVAYQSLFHRVPPTGKYVAHINGVIVVAGTDDGQMWWSAPNSYNHLWPLMNNLPISDSSGHPLTGMAVYYDRLVLFSARTIFEALLDSTGRFLLRPVVSGTGFTANAAVVPIPIGGRDVLMGPSPSGIIAYAGGEPTVILDHWDRVIAGGVNEVDLQNSVACHWRQNHSYLLAVSGKGRALRDRLICYDYTSGAFWLWSAPFGIESLATWATPSGREFILLGTQDGFIQTMIAGDDDDGQSITGILRSHDVTPSLGDNVSAHRLVMQMRTLGVGGTVTYGVFLNRNRIAYSAGNFPVDTGMTSFGTGVFGTSSFSTETEKMQPVNIPSGARPSSIAFAISSTARFAFYGANLEATVHRADRK